EFLGSADRSGADRERGDHAPENAWPLARLFAAYYFQARTRRRGRTSQVRLFGVGEVGRLCFTANARSTIDQILTLQWDFPFQYWEAKFFANGRFHHLRNKSRSSRPRGGTRTPRTRLVA